MFFFVGMEQRQMFKEVFHCRGWSQLSMMASYPPPQHSHSHLEDLGIS